MRVQDNSKAPIRISRFLLSTASSLDSHIKWFDIRLHSSQTDIQVIFLQCAGVRLIQFMILTMGVPQGSRTELAFPSHRHTYGLEARTARDIEDSHISVKLFGKIVAQFDGQE